jgi:dephospho-CoA kinase
MIRIGLTGGIGAGKSTAMKLFSEKGVPCLDTDQLVKDLAARSPALKQELIEALGAEIYADGVYNLKMAGAIIFGADQRRPVLEGIIKKHLLEAIDLWVSKFRNIPYVIIESAIFFETKTADSVDLMVCVNATKDNRVKRVMQRNNMSREEAMKRCEAQISDFDRIMNSDFFIENNDDWQLDTLDELHSQVDRYHDLFVKIGNIVNR